MGKSILDQIPADYFKSTGSWDDAAQKIIDTLGLSEQDIKFMSSENIVQNYGEQYMKALYQSNPDTYGPPAPAVNNAQPAPVPPTYKSEYVTAIDTDYTNYTGGKIQENELAEKRAKARQNYPTYAQERAPSNDENEALAPEDGNEVEETETKSSELGTLRGDAYQHMLDLINKKFSYNSKSSPLYGILREQYEREAERASGRAYARATANAGGYGSSYATLAGEEAARQVMEGFDDNQMALYEAARDEFYSEQQSAVERYQLLDQMYKEQKALEEEEAAEADEQARIAAGGLSDTQYEMYMTAAPAWDSGSSNFIESQLGHLYPDATEADIAAVINALEADDAAKLADDLNAFKDDPTMDGAADLITRAKKTGDAGTVQEVQNVYGELFEKAIENINTAYTYTGHTKEEWQAKTNDEKMTVITELATEAWKKGVISDETYGTILVADIEQSLKENTWDSLGNPNYVGQYLADLMLSIQDMDENGELPDGYKNELLKKIAESDAGSKFLECIEKHDKYNLKGSYSSVAGWDDEDRAAMQILVDYVTSEN